jgi:ribosomal protein S12 methylthiotransferase
MEVQKKISYENNKKRVGEIMEGIVISYNPKTKIYGLRSHWNAPDDIDGNISFKSDKEHKIGDITKVKITSAFVYDLFGECIDK